MNIPLVGIRFPSRLVEGPAPPLPPRVPLPPLFEPAVVFGFAVKRPAPLGDGPPPVFVEFLQFFFSRVRFFPFCRFDVRGIRGSSV